MGEAEDPRALLQFELSPSADEYLLFVNDDDARHGMYELNTDACDAHAGRCDEIASWLTSAALAFLDANLRGDADARAWLDSDDMVIASSGDAEWNRP